MKTRGRPHINSQGRECHCPWGEGQIGEEHVGHVHTASKLEWLEKRPDMQDEKGQAFLKLLKGELQKNPQHGFAKADKLLPWIVREWKKGRIAPKLMFPHRLMYNADGEPLQFNDTDRKVADVLPTPAVHRRDENGALLGYHNLVHISPDDAAAAVQAMDDMKKYRKGIDAMQHKAHEFFPKVQEFQKWKRDQERPDFGEVVHKFPDDWSVRRLQNRDEALAEGEEMGHCVGSHHAPYIDDGRQLILSLRDHNNAPHATIQLEPDHYAHKKTGDTISNEDWRKLYYGEMDPVTMKRGPGDIEKAMKYKPMVGPASTTEQFYGKEDSAPKQEYTDRMNEWLDQHGLYAEPSEGEEEEFEPWWSDEYGAEGVDDPRAYANYDMYDHAPDEYNQASMEAEEHGLDGPSLYMDPDYPHDHYNILGGLTNATGRWWNNGVPIDMTGGYSPELGQAVADKATNPYNYDEDEEQFSEALRDHHSELNDTINWPELEAMPLDEARTEFKKEYGQDPNWQMIQHLGPQLWDQQEWQDKNFLNQFKPPISPNQQMLFYPNYPEGGWQNEDPILHQNYSKTASQLPPLYYRWAFSPDTGVSLSSNEDDHPARVPYHQDLAGKSGKDRQHGYAYRIHGGWRLTDWEHGDVKDPYIVSQVVQALRTQEGPKDESEKPSREAFARLHYGLPL